MRALRSPACLLAPIFAMACLAGRVDAAFVTDASAIPTPFKVVDFSQFNTPMQSPGPVEIGGLVGESITWTASSGLAVIGTSTNYSFGPNGHWDMGRGGFTGTNTSGTSMTYTFNAGPVSAVGGFINYQPGLPGDVIITALGMGGSVLQTYDVATLAPISTPGAVNAGGFRGIVDSTSDIYAFRVSNGVVALDDLTFARPNSAVPEPSSAILAGLGMLNAFAAIRRRRRMT